MSDDETRTDEQCETVECPFWEGDGCACSGVCNAVRDAALAEELAMFNNATNGETT